MIRRLKQDIATGNRVIMLTARAGHVPAVRHRHV
jgi:hypothetical protein